MSRTASTSFETRAQRRARKKRERLLKVGKVPIRRAQEAADRAMQNDPLWKPVWDHVAYLDRLIERLQAFLVEEPTEGLFVVASYMMRRYKREREEVIGAREPRPATLREWYGATSYDHRFLNGRP